jgi:hypothetical protein
MSTGAGFEMRVILKTSEFPSNYLINSREIAPAISEPRN